jgi:ATP phosphoribosyltransferase
VQTVNRQKLILSTFVEADATSDVDRLNQRAKVIRIKDVMPLLTDDDFGATWGILPINQLVEWATQAGYQSFRDVKKDFTILPIGGGKCAVEIACDPNRPDIIDAFEDGGIVGLRTYLEDRGERIATDTPGIATYFFGCELLKVFSGSLEALPKWFTPVIIGIVQSGNSLKEENWYRLADDYADAVLLRSQLAVVIKKDAAQRSSNAALYTDADLDRDFQEQWNGSYRRGSVPKLSNREDF